MLQVPRIPLIVQSSKAFGVKDEELAAGERITTCNIQAEEHIESIDKLHGL